VCVSATKGAYRVCVTAPICHKIASEYKEACNLYHAFCITVALKEDCALYFAVSKASKATLFCVIKKCPDIDLDNAAKNYAK
jgi:hypothetical protein